MSCTPPALLLAVSLSVSSALAQPQENKEPVTVDGYQETIDRLSAIVEGEGANLQAYRELIRALRETGRYKEAEERAREYEAQRPGSNDLTNTLGEILYETGRINAARDAFARANASRAPDRLTAQLNLAVLFYERGDIDEAMLRFDAFIDIYNLSDELTSEELMAVGVACRYLGVNDPDLYKDALRAFDEAIRTDPGNLEARLAVGELFLGKYNSPDARESFGEVLSLNPAHPRALMGMARVMHFDGSSEAYQLTKQALEINPNLVSAHVFLGRLELDLESYEEAESEANSALEINPASLEALALLATARFLRGDTDGFEEARQRAFGRNPRYADFYNILADACVRNRLYQAALDFARLAVELDEKSWWGYGILGLNQLRLGEIEKGRRNLERSFSGDPYNVWIKNTLDLIDTFSQYRESRSDRFLTFIDGKEAEILSIYAVSLLEEAYDYLASRYRYRPSTPIRVEVYPSHADFSVRTIGLAGLGALGVCFGPVVAIDSPSARQKGEFNWGSTLWHELAHTVTLGVTNNKIPRWFSEGLSVYEERLARPGWGDDVSIPFLMAYKQGKLLPIRDLNNGFVRPTYPQQITNSYYQASLLCELVERDYGFQSILDMLAGYKEGKSTAEIFSTVLGCDPDCFDEKLDGYLEERFRQAADALPEPKEDVPGEPLTLQELTERAVDEPENFLAQLAMGSMLFKEGQFSEAEPYLKRAKDLFPHYGGKDSPYWFLAQIYKDRGDKEAASEELSLLVSINESHYDAHLELAELRRQLNDERGSAEILERAVYIYPYEVSTHRRLAELYQGLGDHGKLIRERKALVAVEVVDRAQVLFELALAYYEAGDAARARLETLKAFEIAPGFDDALDLLLKLQPEGSEESF